MSNCATLSFDEWSAEFFDASAQVAHASASLKRQSSSDWQVEQIQRVAAITKHSADSADKFRENLAPRCSREEILEVREAFYSFYVTARALYRLVARLESFHRTSSLESVGESLDRLSDTIEILDLSTDPEIAKRFEEARQEDERGETIEVSPEELDSL